jgi:hypothetical protein
VSLIGFFNNLPFSGKNDLANDVFQFALIFRTLEAFVKTTGIKAGLCAWVSENSTFYILVVLQDQDTGFSALKVE